MQDLPSSENQTASAFQVAKNVTTICRSAARSVVYAASRSSIGCRAPIRNALTLGEKCAPVSVVIGFKPARDCGDRSTLRRSHWVERNGTVERNGPTEERAPRRAGVTSAPGTASGRLSDRSADRRPVQVTDGPRRT